jgi:hypothetical protein
VSADLIDIPYNTSEWYAELEQVNLDRAAIELIVGAIHAALLRHSWKRATEEKLRLIGGALAGRLLALGYKCPGHLKEQWSRVFGIKIR